MKVLSIRSLQGDEFVEVLYNFQMYAFRASPPFQEREPWEKLVRERRGVTFHALYEDGIPVSGAASTAMTQNVRGKLFAASGIWGVVTLPGARRKGYSRQVLTSLLTAEKESGKIFSNLYPFRESFYERLGFVTYPLPITAHLSPISLVPLLKMDHGGKVELMLIGDAFDDYREYLVQMRPKVHGMAFFDEGDRAAAQRNRLWAAFAKVNGNVEGMMLYSLQGEEVGKFKFYAPRFYYKSSRGRYLLLDWIAQHADQADRAEIWLAPDQHPETWLADLQVKVETQVRAPMTRILNAAEMNGMQTGPGKFSARIVDPVWPSNQDSWLFSSTPDGLQVSRTDQVDCELSIQGLTALIFGAHEPQDFTVRGWGDPSPEVQSIMRSMFPPQTPFLHEMF